MAALTKAFVNDIFLPLLNGNSAEFFRHVADNVNWQVMGTHPLAGTYHQKEEFLNATFRRLSHVLKEGVLLKLVNVIVEGNVAAVELRALSTQNNGKPFDNVYCWVMYFDNDLKVTQVRAYLDSALVKEAIENNEKH
jgi:ketosteroid isomerase-like protein